MIDDLDEAVDELGDPRLFRENDLTGDLILRCIQDADDVGDFVGDYTVGTRYFNPSYYEQVCDVVEYAAAWVRLQSG